MLFRYTIFIAFLVSLGCTPADNGRVPMKGTVEYQGEPVSYGAVSLRPSGEASGVASGAEIRDGVYEIPKASGPSQGTYEARFTLIDKQEENQEQRFGGGNMNMITVNVEITSEQEVYDFKLPLEEAR